MVAATSLFPLQAPRAEDEQRILLSSVTWEAYVALRDSIEIGTDDLSRWVA